MRERHSAAEKVNSTPSVATAENKQRLLFCPGRLRCRGEVYAIPNLSAVMVAQHGFELPNLRVRSEWVPYAAIAHGEKQGEIAAISRRCRNLERSCTRRLKYLWRR